MQKIFFNEVWKDIAEFDGYYQVSNYGRVRRSDNHRIKASPLNAYGYPQVNLYKNGKAHLRRVIFVSRMQGRMEFPHEFLSGARRERQALLEQGLVYVQMDESGKVIREFSNITSAVKETGILATSISNCLHGRSSLAGGYKWSLI